MNPVFRMFVSNYSNVFTESSAHVTLLYMQDNDSCTHKHNPNALQSRIPKKLFICLIWVKNSGTASQQILDLQCTVKDTVIYAVKQVSALMLLAPEGFGAISASHCVKTYHTFLLWFSVSGFSFLQAFRLCKMDINDRSSDILKMAAFAEHPLLHETRPSSTKTPADKRPISQLARYISACVFVCAYMPADKFLSWLF